MSDTLLWDTGHRVWLALVCFERGEDTSGVLDPRYAGACGWIVAMATDEPAMVSQLHQEFAGLGFRNVSVSSVRTVDHIDDVAAVDAHLATNLKAWETGAFFCWGELQCYADEAEA